MLSKHKKEILSISKEISNTYKRAYRYLAAKRVISYACENGFDCISLTRSPIEGGDGNKEYLAYFIKKQCIEPRVDDRMIKRITAN